MFLSLFSFGQDIATIKGKLIDEDGNPLSGATIQILEEKLVTTSDKNGTYSLKVPSNKKLIVNYSFIGMKTKRVEIQLSPGQVFTSDYKLKLQAKVIEGATVTDRRLSEAGLEKIDPKIVDLINVPNPSIEKGLAYQALGVFSSNELSSQYTVRGGNFDENLIYVNGIEIYRPFLVRSGRQEGLSFINPDMVKSVTFSSGGFAAKYGDKMSSVLDVEYKEPTRKFGGSAEVSLLGGSAHIENRSDDSRFTQVHGVRYRTNQYLLSSLDTDGNYKPLFFDYQGYLSYDVTDRFEIGSLFSVGRNRYEFIPENRQTEFGSINQALQFTVFFDGKEINEYTTYLGALTANYYTPSEKVRLNFTTSAYTSIEEENFDIEGAYRIDELERDLGSDNFGNVAFNRGVGGLINHARNELQATVFSATHKGAFFIDDQSTLEWGVKGNIEQITDEFSEWEMIDSAGYSIPQFPGERIELYNTVRNENDIQSNRLSGFVQYSKAFSKDSNLINFTIGTRAAYWDFNNELVGGPRASISFQPNWEKKFTFKAASGFYYQQPFYREMRDFDGNLNENIKAQRAIHYVLGMDYEFSMWDRPFKFSTEAYYKDLKNLIPYEIDNVRLRYYADNNAVGYTYGIDFKINGEFVKGVESWASMSFMSTQEDILDDFYYLYYDAEGERTTPGNRFRPVADSTRFKPGYVPRPTDQRFNFSLFFQDYLPNNPTVKVNLSFIYGSGLPFGPPSYDRYRDTLRIPAYRRVDLGMSKLLLNSDKEARKGIGTKKIFNHIDNIWLSIEIFNLLQVQNTISYQWVRDIQGIQWPVPNYLTARQINARLQVKF